MTNETPCKGFWNMCPCEKCREKDRKLQTSTPEEKKRAKESFLQHIRQKNRLSQ